MTRTREENAADLSFEANQPPQKFTTPFDSYVCDGDNIRCELAGGFTATATLHYDDNNESPDERQEGFWPSHDPNDAGWVKPENFDAEQAKAERVMRAWKNDEWHYYGVTVNVYKLGIQLTRDYAHAVWGIEGNYPDGDNGYFLEVANELLAEALEDAKEVVRKLTADVQADY